VVNNGDRIHGVSFFAADGGFAARGAMKGERRRKDPTVRLGFSYEKIAMTNQRLDSLFVGHPS
jgi:hypothetical protein